MFEADAAVAMPVDEAELELLDELEPKLEMIACSACNAELLLELPPDP